MNMYEWMIINDEIRDEFYAQIILGKFETVGSLNSNNNNRPLILGLILSGYFKLKGLQALGDLCSTKRKTCKIMT